MAHSIIVADEQYVFKTETRNWLFIILGVGIVFLILGLFLDMNSGGGHDEGHALLKNQELTASTAAIPQEEHAAEAEHHGSAPWLKKLYASLWMNNVFFTGLGIIGLFFVAIQYAAQAGWSAGFLRVPLAMGNWIPIAGILMIVLYFLTSHDIFHWTHEGLYKEGPEFDPLINKKAP